MECCRDCWHVASEAAAEWARSVMTLTVSSAAANADTAGDEEGGGEGSGEERGATDEDLGTATESRGFGIDDKRIINP